MTSSKRNKRNPSADTSLPIILDMLDRAYDRKSWHGTNLKGSIRGLKASQASWRPAANRHSIWEIVNHAAYWKYIVWRKLSGQLKTSFSIKGNNWFKQPENPDDSEWKKAIARLDNYHQLLRQTIEILPVSDFYRLAKNSKLLTIDFILGVAAHDLYHAGQIQLLKRMQK
jgi:uncharacterized damage-inducible protein DinB